MDSNLSELSVNFTVTFRGKPYSISLVPGSTIADLQATLEELTSVPPPLQKLLCKGKKIGQEDSASTLTLAGIKNGMKIQMLGTTPSALSDVKAAEMEKHRIDKIYRERASKAPVKLRNTGRGSTTNLSFRFHTVQSLSHLPNPDAALAVLRRLSEDPAILHIMQKHSFSVGLLTELAPHEHPELLGLNVNHGQSIKLRVRTDRYDGFRTYREVRRCLCHELTHNVWGDHDEKFKALCSQLNREVAEYEKSVLAGSHRLMEGGPSYHAEGLPSESHNYVLGGSSVSSPSETLNDRRQRMLQATMTRLNRKDLEIEQIMESTGCGTTKNTTNTHP